MTYQAKDYKHLLGLKGFSDELLNNHFTLYNGYVANTNKATDLLKTLDPSSYEFAEVKRRFGWEFNGMRLHEYYFENMTHDHAPIDQDSELYEKIARDFGSYDNFMKEFLAMGIMRGIGWVVLYVDEQADKLFTMWINEHDVAHPAGCKPLLVMDVFEHAFMVDYGLKRADYVKAFVDAIDWKAVQERL